MIIDLDANSTYLPSEEIQEVMKLAWRRLGNPSSLHRGGQRARAEIERAREAVRYLVGAEKGDLVVFTSGATESNNMVLRAPWRSLAVSATEHPCVLGPARRVASAGAELRIIPVNEDGEVKTSHLEEALSRHTDFISIMAANNETGAINDIHELARVARSACPGAHIHTDAAQIVGKESISFAALGVDSMTISGHKFGALSGVGALIIREGIQLEPLLVGGVQESKLRGGTENVMGIISLGVAAQAVRETLSVRASTMSELRNCFEDSLLTTLAGVEINAKGAQRLPNTSNIFLAGSRGDDLVIALDREGILVSSGAACSSGKPEPSHVLMAMGQSEERVRSTIRVSFRADQSKEIVPRAVSAIVGAVSRMRSATSEN